VSLALARQRARTLADVRYEFDLTVPPHAGTPLSGTLTIELTRRGSGPVVLDFAGPADGVRGVVLDGRAIDADVVSEHIVVPVPGRDGRHRIAIEFRAGDGALNRTEDFLYTLFVPDRARTAFPCIDQPDIKARFTLTLTVPPGWTAVANAALAVADTTASGVRYRFHETAPLPTYLFAFVAGRFEVRSAVRDGRVLRMVHRETDPARLTRNADAIFDLHAEALDWLESYTGVPYPFEKFDFVAIPSFQYGGMEHPGAVLYRAGRLFLDEAPTQSELLGRASLIAHETAHMWFGDLVTMRWFDDVWMKEVFANFMAAKIVHPAFPTIDHELQFFLAHHPAAYAVDRTAGTNPIRQDLDNLAEAGSLYGAIIYQKAPIVMRQLEQLVGERALRDGLRAYLERFAFGTAQWSDLIAILDARTADDLARWSAIWVESAGRPRVDVRLDTAGDQIRRLELSQSDPAARGRLWPQTMSVVLGYADSIVRLPARLVARRVAVEGAPGRRAPLYVLPGADGRGYAEIRLDAAGRAGLSAWIAASPSPLVRAVGWMALWESVLAGETDPDDFIRHGLAALPGEAEELNAHLLLGLLDQAYWRYLSPRERRDAASGVEAALWAELERSETPSRKAACFESLVSLAVTQPTLARLEAVWSGESVLTDLPLGEQRLTALAEALALRDVPEAESILADQLARIENPDRRARLAFIVPALSEDAAVRDSVFESFRDPVNREREPWVLAALAYLNHPLRADHAVRYIRPALELVEEIQRTGDIFFPLRWLHAVLDGHQSEQAASTVTAFLEEHPDYPPRLRGKILQAADGLFRATASEAVPPELSQR
jgi:aminopeptidase N